MRIHLIRVLILYKREIFNKMFGTQVLNRVKGKLASLLNVSSQIYLQ